MPAGDSKAALSKGRMATSAMVSVRAAMSGLALRHAGMIGLVTVALVLAMVALATARLKGELLAAFESKGEAIALAVATSTEQGGGTDRFLVQSAVDGNARIEAVKYVFVLDANGAVYAHSFQRGVSPELLRANPIGAGDLGARRVKVRSDVVYQDENGAQSALDVAALAGGGAMGSVHVGLDQEIISAQVERLRWSMLRWGLLLSLAGIAVYLLMARLTVLRPIEQLTTATGEIVRTGDLTRVLDLEAAGEIGQLGESFGRMVGKLKEMTLRLRSGTGSLANSVSSLNNSAAGQRDALTGQATALQQMQATATEIRQTSALASQKAQAILEQTTHAETVSQSGTAAVAQGLATLEDIRTQVQGIAESIVRLEPRTAQIGRIAETVKDIADQSNMLALNAAIEAARSGEHARGFTVVAREIRSLADQSVNSTRQVRQILEELSEAIRDVVSTTARGSQRIEAGLSEVRTSGEKMGELSTIIRDTSNAVRQIHAAVQQQNAGVGELFTGVRSQNELMEQTLQRLEETTTLVDTVREVSSQLGEMVKEFNV